MKHSTILFSLLQKCICLTMLAVAISACGGNVTPEPDPGPDIPVPAGSQSVRGMQVESEAETIDMPETAVFVKEDINSGLVSYDPDKGTITFNETDALKKADIKVGDVLYSTAAGSVAPRGYILKVTDIQKKGGRIGQVVYTVEEAGLEDVFDHLETKVPFEMDRLSEDDFTVWDPFDQADQTDNIMRWPDDGEAVGTKSGDFEWFPDFSIGRKWDKERYDLKIGPTETTLKSILYDLDDNYKTKNDQITLTVKLSYDADLGDFYYTFDKKLMVLGLDFTPEVGISAELSLFKREATAEAEGETNNLEKKREALDDAAKKLIGKKFCIMSFDIPVGPASIFVDPHVEVYLIFKLDINGEISVEAGLEKFPIHMHAENVPYMAVTNYLKSGVGIETKPKVYSKIIVDVDLEGKAGLGAGFFCNMPKIAKLITDKKDVVPYIGFFVDGTVNGKASAKMEVKPGNEASTLNLHAEAFAEVEGYFKLYAHFKQDLIWNDKLTLASYRWPEKDDDRFTWDTTLVARKPYPVPYGVSPEHRAIVQENEVELKWDIPLHFFEGTNDDGRFDGLTYAVYLGTDRVLVSQSTPQVRVAEGLEGKTFTCPVEKDLTYYWKIVCTNGFGWDYESPVYSFDTGYDGMAKLNKELARYLRNHPDVLYGVRVEEDGSIFRTPSNLKALAEIKDVKIKDPEGKYTIREIDDLLMLLPGLTDLDCSHNHLSTITLLENPRLEHLVCTDNELKTLPLRYTPRLESLKCSNNPQLKELDFKSCPDLVVLTVDHCALEYLDLTRNTKLDGVYASDCALDSLDVSRCPKLLRLDFHGQSKERVKLRLSHAQKEQFSLFQPHVNTDYEYVDDYPIVTDEAFDITATSASIPVTILVDNYLPERGVIYTAKTDEPEYGQNMHVTVDTKEKYFIVTLTGLEPDTQYYARGYGRNPTNFQTGYGNVITFRTKTAEPAPRLSLEQTEYDFGVVLIGDSAGKEVVVKNTGELDLSYEIVCPQDSPFSATPDGTVTIAPGDSLTVTFSFVPTQAGVIAGEFIFRSNDPRGDIPFRVWGEGKPDIPTEGLIEFADPLVKSICVGKWDSDGDGELSYLEAAAVTSLDYAFAESKITSFNELQYFVGVTKMSSEFYNCKSLKNAIIPGSVTELGGAFWGCQSLTGITVPASVEHMYEAFAACYALKDVTIAPGLKSIDKGAFSSCTSLERITIPEGTVSIGSKAFYGCSALTAVSVPNSLESIADQAFQDATRLESFRFNSGLKSVGMNAFKGCRKLGSIIVEDASTVFGRWAFQNCIALSDVQLPEGMPRIFDCMFYGCRSLKSISIPSSVTCISEGAFAECSSLEEMVLSESIKEVEAGAFRGCASLKKLVLPSSMTTIPADLCSECSALEHLDIPSGVTEIGYEAFYSCYSLKDLVIPSGVTKISSNAFFSCSSLEHLTIPSGVSVIEEQTFANCTSLASIDFMGPVSAVKDNAFVSCKDLREISLRGVTSLSAKAFKNCSAMSKIEIQGELTSLPEDVFSGCSALKDINIPTDNLTSIGSRAFYGCGSLASYTVPAKVTNIGGGAFWNCGAMVSITIPDGVKSLGERALAGCSSLKELTLPGSIESLGHYLCSGCSSLETVRFGKGITALPHYCFENCGALVNVYLPEGMTELGYTTFVSCSSLKRITIPEGVTTIPYQMFWRCTSLEDVALPNSLKDIDFAAFNGCSSLTSITIPANVTSIGDLSLGGCPALKTVKVYPVVPPYLGTGFYAETKIYVPSGSLSAYKSAAGWKNYANQMYGM
ncbi:MAG: leucine-rich repeat protein [Bacteroidales bacterium]|nr:leucine-rich repeat protein [Bacteroidales bacterium]